MSAQLAAASLVDFPPSVAKPAKPISIALARHARKCCICHHADRPEIEDDFLHWHAATDIASDYSLPDRRVVYRHARATGLYQRRMRNMRVASSYIVQHAERVTPNAKQVLDAVRACSLIDQDGVWHEPIRHVIIEHVNVAQTPSDFAAAQPETASATAQNPDISNVYSMQLESAATPTKQTPAPSSNVYSSEVSHHSNSTAKILSAPNAKSASIAPPKSKSWRDWPIFSFKRSIEESLHKMKTLTGILVIAALCAMAAHARPALSPADATDAEALASRARAMENLRAPGSQAFLLRAKIKVSNGKGASQEGEYGLNWWSGERWQESLKIGDFGRGREGVKDGYWQSRLEDFQPEAIFDFDRALNLADTLKLGAEEYWGKVSTDKNHGDPLSCVAVNWKKNLARTLCFEQSTGKLAHVKIGFSPLNGSGRTIDYSDFMPLGEKQFPGKITVTAKDSESVEISVTKLAPLTSPAPTDVAKGANSEFWRACDDAVEPTLDSQVQPKYPDESKWNHEQGQVTMYMRIEADGTVSHLRVLSSPFPRLSQGSMDAVSRWKYKPAKCGDTPIPRETMTTVVYTLGG